MSKHLTRERLRELLEYDPLTGLFTRTKNGRLAGATDSHGHIQIRVEGKLHLAHRLAFLWATGSFPENDVDHINRIRSDNRWSNLRAATRQQNSYNRGKQSNNTSGIVGVRWNSDCKKWQAQIGVNGRRYYLGLYRTIEDAAQVYNGAAALVFGEFHREN